MAHRLLLEIGCEEIPARFMPGALTRLGEEGAAQLRQARLSYTSLRTLGTPRRLALLVEGIAEAQAEQVEEVKGPSAAVAFGENGEPTRAAQGFARLQGVSVESLQVKETPQGKYVFAVRREPGEPASAVVGECLTAVIRSLQFPKSMRWADHGIRFARPIRWLVALLDGEIIDVEYAGLTSSRTSYGHRLLSPGPVTIRDPADYVEQLRERAVIVDQDERRATIWVQAQAAARAVGGRVDENPALLDEVTYLVEAPTALGGNFDPDYLHLPSEVLVTSMESHQRYFPVVGADGRLLPHFVAISNGAPERGEAIVKGHENVLSARLADARFFFDEDRREPLANLYPQLERIVFQDKLGTVAQKAERLRALGRGLAERFGLSEKETEWVERAAHLAKVDWVTKMVGEFPELQGVMGREYALASGEPEPVATAIFEHVLPRHAGDDRPQSSVGAVVALADRLDTLTGCFAVGLVPTGSQDPYGLRRAALGAVMICLDHRFPLDLTSAVRESLALYGSLGEGEHATPETDGQEGVVDDVVEFIRQRLRGYLMEAGCRHDVVEAAMAAAPDDLVEAARRARELQRWRTHPTLEEVVRVYQRVANLARQAEEDGVTVDETLFRHPAEQKLLQALRDAAPRVSAADGEGNMAAALEHLAGLGPAVDEFFDAVLVMDPDRAVRNNRLALLAEARSIFVRVADWSRLEGSA